MWLSAPFESASKSLCRKPVGVCRTSPQSIEHFCHEEILSSAKWLPILFWPELAFRALLTSKSGCRLHSLICVLLFGRLIVGAVCHAHRWQWSRRHGKRQWPGLGARGCLMIPSCCPGKNQLLLVALQHQSDDHSVVSQEGLHNCVYCIC